MGWNIFDKVGIPGELANMAAVAGRMPGFNTINKFGFADGITTTQRVIFDGGNRDYIYTDPGSPEGYRLMNTNVLATQNIAHHTLDSDWVPQVATHTLTGTTPISIGTRIRGFRMNAIGPGRDDVPGTTYLVGSGVVGAGTPVATSLIRAQINNPLNQTQMCIFPVSGTQIFYLGGYYFGFTRSTGVSAVIGEVSLWVGGTAMPFQQKHILPGQNTGGAPFRYKYEYPLEIQAKSDVEIRGIFSAASGIAAGFWGCLVDK